MGKEKTVVDCLIEKNQECERLKDALRNILMNTLHRDFDGDFVYKAGVIGNIKMGLSKEEYEYAVELYS